MVSQKNFKSQLNEVSDKILVHELEEKTSIKEQKTFSKKNVTLIDKKQYQAIKLGTEIHEYLEYLDFKNPNLEIIDNLFIREHLQQFLDHSIMKNVKDAVVYQEYEFIFDDVTEEYHGVIDLMLEYNDHIDIIDYKLKNIEDEAYIKQLKGYQKFVELKMNKKVSLYLYSILEKKISLID